MGTENDAEGVGGGGVMRKGLLWGVGVEDM